MAAPSVLARQASVSSTSDSNSFTPTLATATTGKTLLAVISADGSPTLSTSSTGWRKLGQSSNGANVTQAVFVKDKATASNTLVVNSSANEQYSAEVFCIDAGSLPGLNIAFANGNSTNSNPPSVTISPSQDVLWIATRSGDAQVVATAAPSGYSNLTSQAGGGANGASTNTAELSVSADASEDPGTFTSATEQWVSATIGIWSDTISRFIQYNKPTSWTLSNSSLTATQTGLGVGGTTMLTSLAHLSGKWYFEITPSAGDAISICIAPYSANVNDYPDSSGGINYSALSGAIYVAGVQVATIQTASTGQTTAGCIDVGTGDVWFKNISTGSNWNNSGTADPATGTGGINVPTLANVNVMPGMGGENSASVGTAAAWNGAPTSTKPSGFSNWDSSGGNALTASATLSGAGSLVAAGSAGKRGSATFSAAASLTAAASAGKRASSNLSGAGALSAAASRPLTASGTFGAVSSLSAAAVRRLFGSATFSGVGSITANAQLGSEDGSLTASATLSASGSMAAAASRGLRPSAALFAAGALSAAASRGARASATLSASSTMTAAAVRTRGASVALSAQANLTAYAALGRRAAAMLSAQSALSAGASHGISASVILSAVSYMEARAILGSEAELVIDPRSFSWITRRNTASLIDHRVTARLATKRQQSSLMGEQ